MKWKVILGAYIIKTKKDIMNEWMNVKFWRCYLQRKNLYKMLLIKGKINEWILISKDV